MTDNAGRGTRVLGSLRSADGTGIVRIEDRYDTDIDDLWSALTDPGRLARWYGEVEGRRRPHHPCHRDPRDAVEQDRLLRGRVADPRRELATYLAGREPGDTEGRWDELVPPYQELAATIA